MNAQRPSPTWRAGLAALLALPTLAAAMRFDEHVEREFLWHQAETQVASATTEADFLRAAETYRAVVRAGGGNGPLFYNMGVALLNAGMYDEALRALIRAERHMGSSPDIRRNMRLALARERDPADVFLPWQRLFLFWHCGLGFRTRAGLAVGAFAGFWLAMSLMAFGLRARPVRLLRALSATLFILYVSSVAASLLHERRDELRDRMRISVSEGFDT